MLKYPILSAKEIIAALKKLGFGVIKQKGSHIKLRKQSLNKKFTTIVPNHKIVAMGTLKGVLELAEVKLEDFLRQL